jgi:hypothetical protein
MNPCQTRLFSQFFGNELAKLSSWGEAARKSSMVPISNPKEKKSDILLIYLMIFLPLLKLGELVVKMNPNLHKGACNHVSLLISKTNAKLFINDVLYTFLSNKRMG